MLKLEYRPFGILNSESDSDFFFVCDHATNFVPRSMFGLGLGKSDLFSHISYDIGALPVAIALALKFEASLIWQNYSRLMIDCNRQLNHEGLIPEVSDNITIDGNRSLSEQSRNDRIKLIFKPYHLEIDKRLNHREKKCGQTFFVSVHSFTPTMNRIQRPWEIGVLSDGNEKFSLMVFELLRSRYDFCVGFNEPYRVDSKDFTIPEHATKRSFPSVLIEIRQDLIATEKSQRFWIEILATVLSNAREDYLAESRK